MKQNCLCISQKLFCISPSKYSSYNSEIIKIDKRFIILKKMFFTYLIYTEFQKNNII